MNDFLKSIKQNWSELSKAEKRAVVIRFFLCGLQPSVLIIYISGWHQLWILAFLPFIPIGIYGAYYHTFVKPGLLAEDTVTPVEWAVLVGTTLFGLGVLSFFWLILSISAMFPHIVELVIIISFTAYGISTLFMLIVGVWIAQEISAFILKSR